MSPLDYVIEKRSVKHAFEKKYFPVPTKATCIGFVEGTRPPANAVMQSKLRHTYLGIANYMLMVARMTGLMKLQWRM